MSAISTQHQVSISVLVPASHGHDYIDAMPGPKRFAASRLRSQPRQPKPGEHVWTLWKNRRIDGELRFHGEPFGCEVQFLHDHELAYGQRCVTHAAAMGDAENQRRRLINAGWAPPAGERDSSRESICSQEGFTSTPKSYAVTTWETYT
jgi:hypothetical protein